MAWSIEAASVEAREIVPAEQSLVVMTSKESAAVHEVYPTFLPFNVTHDVMSPY